MKKVKYETLKAIMYHVALRSKLGKNCEFNCSFPLTPIQNEWNEINGVHRLLTAMVILDCKFLYSTILTISRITRGQSSLLN